MTLPRPDMLPIKFAPPPARPRAGTRRAPEVGPWRMLTGGGFTLGCIVAAVESFSLAGWNQVAIIGLLATFCPVAGLLLATWGTLAKVQDQQARLADAIRDLHGRTPRHAVTVWPPKSGRWTA